jgi:hypothetical protein
LFHPTFCRMDHPLDASACRDMNWYDQLADVRAQSSKYCV